MCRFLYILSLCTAMIFKSDLDVIVQECARTHILGLRVFLTKNLSFSSVQGCTLQYRHGGRWFHAAASLRRKLVVEQLYTDVQRLNSLHRKLLFHLRKHLGDFFFFRFLIRFVVLYQLRRNFFQKRRRTAFQ